MTAEAVLEIKHFAYKMECLLSGFKFHLFSFLRTAMLSFILASEKFLGPQVHAAECAALDNLKF